MFCINFVHKIDLFKFIKFTRVSDKKWKIYDVAFLYNGVKMAKTKQWFYKTIFNSIIMDVNKYNSFKKILIVHQLLTYQSTFFADMKQECVLFMVFTLTAFEIKILPIEN